MILACSDKNIFVKNINILFENYNLSFLTACELNALFNRWNVYDGLIYIQIEDWDGKNTLISFGSEQDYKRHSKDCERMDTKYCYPVLYSVASILSTDYILVKKET